MTKPLRQLDVDFILKGMDKYGFDRFDYTNVEPTKNKDVKVSIACKYHGKFFVTRQYHIAAREGGCPPCISKTHTTEKFISASKVIFGEDRFDYSKAKYVGSDELIILGCADHGFFTTKPHYHKVSKTGGCVKCGRLLLSHPSAFAITHEEFKRKAIEKHGDRFDYDGIDWTNYTTEVQFRCKVHGEFLQTPKNHLKAKCGCPKCSLTQAGIDGRMGIEEFKRRSMALFGDDQFDYSLVRMVTTKDPIILICKDHGEFEVIVEYHLSSVHGCKKCAKKGPSKQEEDVYRYIRDDLGLEDAVQSDQTVFPGKFEADMYIPSKKIAIEYNGVVFHSSKFNPNKKAHLDKTVWGRDVGVQVIHIFSDEWLFRNTQVKSFLRAILGKNVNSIGARNTEFSIIDPNQAKTFIEKNHVLGAKRSSPFNYGLLDETTGELLMVMTFAPHHRSPSNDTITLNRLCSKMGMSVQGGASKLLKHAILVLKSCNPNLSKIVSWSDNRWSSGNVYVKMGFSDDGALNCDYTYTDGTRRYAKQSYAKKKIGCPEHKTEEECCAEQNLFRVYDSGKIRWILDI